MKSDINKIFENYVFNTIFIICFLWLSSCSDNRLYDQCIDIDKTGWPEEKELAYTFSVPDTAESYVLYYTLRYTNDYAYYNLYVKRYMYDSTGKLLSEKLQGMDIFDPKTGAPYGSGMSKTYDYTVLSEPDFKFPHAGKYTIKIKQFMRQSVLTGIKAFGIRLEGKGN
ncbi:MAG: gliding motility lipoprotein GldH [Cytophagaceae bacterium]|nr:gliding motility lipoprotein GldH [Cytophagaceae bacterium]MDW8456324.1 gliding motility lipoprotein GldH [Cytophagaceae bacterium]